MNLKHVLVSMPLKPEHRGQFLRAMPDADVRFARAAELTDAELAGFDALVGNPKPELLAKMTGLKFVQLISSGVPAEYLGLRERSPGVVLCSSSGAFGLAISEHMLGMLLALVKRLHEYRDDQHAALWKDRGTVRAIRGMRVLVVGAGSIGASFARLVKAMGAVTVGVRRAPGQTDPAFDEMHTTEDLDSLLPQADVVALSLPETPETIGLMDERRFGLLKEGSYLLNVGRGSVIDQDALLAALKGGRLAGAGIDVASPEPLPPGHPLWQEKNMLITPHISGYYNLRETHDQGVDIACGNLRAFPGGPFTSRVDFQSGYRARES